MRKKLFILIFIACTAACKKGSTPKGAVADPSAVALIVPVKNEVCANGTILSADESRIKFQWGAAANSNSYEVTVKNLDNGTTVSQSTTETTLEIPLKRNTPYSWYVTSKHNLSNAIAKSEVWKFFNAGAGTTNYAPYPADELLPAKNTTVGAVAGKINLAWLGADPDNDQLEYAVYFGTAPAPPLLAEHITRSQLENVTVSTKTVYYWKVVTRDVYGNTSDSGIVSFNVL